jgi:competence protein ComEC
MLTGDVGRAGELAIVEGSLLTKVDVLKIAHHGSKTSTSAEFVAAIRPETSVISCGLKNSYGHPHKDTLATLEDAGSEVLRTDEHGTIKYVQASDGNWSWKWQH